MKSVIFRPYWNVPLDIQRNELLPELKKNPDYLQKHSYEVVDSDGKVVSDDGVSEEMRKQICVRKAGHSAKARRRQFTGAREVRHAQCL